MNLNKNVSGFILRADVDEVSRRAFFAKNFACVAGLRLLAHPKATISYAQESISREEAFKELDTKVDRYMAKYGSCALSSFAALNEHFGLKYDALVPALMPFTGGIASKGETCGAVSGSMLAIGIFFSSADSQGNKRTASPMKFGSLFFDGFEKEFGSTRCREVIRHQYGRYFNFGDPADLKLYLELSKKGKNCTDVVKKAVRLAATIFMDEAQR